MDMDGEHRGASSYSRGRRKGVLKNSAAEQTAQFFLPEREDPSHVTADQGAGDPAHARHELDVIDHPRTSAGRLEPVLVVPPAVRSQHLAVDEAHAGLP